MIINQTLRKTLLISFFWHLFWISFVSIVFLPSNLKPRTYSSVYFLGSILASPISVERVALSSAKDITKLPSEVDSIFSSNYFDERPYSSLMLDKKAIKPDSFIDVDVRLRQGYGGLSTEALAKVDARQSSGTSGASFVSKESFRQEREIIFQPAFLKYPEWAQQEFRSEYVIFKIYISTEGLVEELIHMQTSGNAEVDVVLARYIERCRFAPSPGQQAPGQEGQWQFVKINLDFDDFPAITIISEEPIGLESQENE